MRPPAHITQSAYTHPHPDPEWVMLRYRGHILGCKRKYGWARGLIHYRRLIDEYLAAKRLVISRGRKS